MHSVFTIFRFYPYWALPVALIFAELARHFHRRGKFAKWYCLGMVGLLFALTIVWFVYRGDLNSDAWVRSMSGG